MSWKVNNAHNTRSFVEDDVLEYTGTKRAALRAAFDDHHLIVTTYGTLRKDVIQLQANQFEYVVLESTA